MNVLATVGNRTPSFSVDPLKLLSARVDKFIIQIALSRDVVEGSLR